LFDEHLEEVDQPISMPVKNQPEIRPSTGVWIEKFLSSTGYKDQKGLVRRHALDDELVRRCLEAVNSSGGIMTPVAFSKAAEIPPVRLDGLIKQLQRLLNVDGYEILTFSRTENRVELNITKLKRQFDLD
jgi:hypothetical protein